MSAVDYLNEIARLEGQRDGIAAQLRYVTAVRDRYEAALYRIASEAAGGEDPSDPDECDRCAALIETAETALELSAAMECVEAVT